MVRITKFKSIQENKHKSDAHSVLNLQTLEKIYFGHGHNVIVTEF